MTTTSSMSDKYALLREDALQNIEVLFSVWGLDWTKVSDTEYDFKNPTRIDNNFGAARFNVEKGIGADFANSGFSDIDFSGFGSGFDRTDFGFSSNRAVSHGFDIISLYRHLHNSPSYRDAANALEKQLKLLEKDGSIKRAAFDAAALRAEQIRKKKHKMRTLAFNLLAYCKPYKGTLGQTYLEARKIILKSDEPNIRFHNNVYNSEVNKYFPALVFPIQDKPLGDVKGIHRIYLDPEGYRKAPLAEAKVALGEVSGNGIWFGNPGETLCIAEGPENALTLRMVAYDFVVCTVFSTNFASLTIPKYVKNIVLCPDPDQAGIRGAVKAKKNYQGRNITVRYPKPILLDNGKYADFNDILMGVGQ